MSIWLGYQSRHVSEHGSEPMCLNMSLNMALMQARHDIQSASMLCKLDLFAAQLIDTIEVGASVRLSLFGLCLSLNLH